ncbi:cyclin-dependent kinase inhibitor 7 isoform X2 [Argentina anserina]|uniref:cyclin-dependent kinase inhibitor 7 isoform X2 n=1 Tax=Argentina anserina TaxID=57926 RepID=UPI0021766E08|nr:cyclin-dependent kinase inhibitor 7 isoform X2 [Potentilla anserina]
MEAKDAETSSAKKRKQVDVAQLVKTKLVQLNKKRRRLVVTVTKSPEETQTIQCAINGTVREAKEDDDNAVCASPNSSGSDHINVDETSFCSSNGSSELVEDGSNPNLVDLEADDDDESDEVESQTYNPLRERRQMAPSSNLQPQQTPTEPRRGATAEKIPTEMELEEFFTAAEKHIQSKFSEKYNYDVRKDEPLEGRYEWTRLKP